MQQVERRQLECGRCGRELHRGDLARVHKLDDGTELRCDRARCTPRHTGLESLDSVVGDSGSALTRHGTHGSTHAWAQADSLVPDEVPRLKRLMVEELHQVATPTQLRLFSVVVGTTATTLLQAGKLLGLNPTTVRSHTRHLFARLGDDFYARWGTSWRKD